MPKAPGTWGTLTALPFAFLIYLIGGPAVLLVAAIFAFVVGIWASAAYAAAAGKPDPSEVVIDEVAAIWLVLTFVPFTWIFWSLAFISFRFFDVLKPWPINMADAKLKGGFGIMFDDVIAAIYAILCVTIFLYLMKAL
jgi:phosphatidylglycerophosphatase A